MGILPGEMKISNAIEFFGPSATQTTVYLYKPVSNLKENSSRDWENLKNYFFRGIPFSSNRFLVMTLIFFLLEWISLQCQGTSRGEIRAEGGRLG